MTDPREAALRRAARRLADNIDEFGKITDGEFLDDLWRTLEALYRPAAPPPDPEKELGESKKNQQNSGPEGGAPTCNGNCFQAGGPFIAEDPACPLHGDTDADDGDYQAERGSRS